MIGAEGFAVRPLGLSPWWFVLGSAGLLVVMLGVWRFLDWKESRSDRINEGEVCGVVGKPGAGKTLFAVRLARSKLAAGAKVCTNFSLDLPDEWRDRWTPFHDFSDMVRLTDAVIILDEAHIYADSGSKLSKSAAWWLSQVRRMGCQLIWVSQNEMRVSKTLRDLTNYVWVCSRSTTYFRKRYRFRATLYEPEHLRAEGKHLQIRRWRQDDELFALFDSWEILAPKDDQSPEGLVIQELAAARNGKPEPVAQLPVRQPGDWRRLVEQHQEQRLTQAEATRGAEMA